MNDEIISINILVFPCLFVTLAFFSLIRNFASNYLVKPSSVFRVITE